MTVEAAEEMAAFDRLPKPLQSFIREHECELLAKDIEPIVTLWGQRRALVIVEQYVRDWKREHPLFDPGH